MQQFAQPHVTAPNRSKIITIASTQKPLQPNPSNDTLDTSLAVTKRNRKKAKEKTTFIFELPSWLIHEAWKFEVARPRRLWSLQLRPVKIVSNDSKIFDLCASGDYDGVR